MNGRAIGPHSRGAFSLFKTRLHVPHRKKNVRECQLSPFSSLCLSFSISPFYLFLNLFCMSTAERKVQPSLTRFVRCLFLQAKARDEDRNSDDCDDCSDATKNDADDLACRQRSTGTGCGAEKHGNEAHMKVTRSRLRDFRSVIVKVLLMTL